MRISDWSSDVCSSDLCAWRTSGTQGWTQEDRNLLDNIAGQVGLAIEQLDRHTEMTALSMTDPLTRSEEHTSELQSLMRISYAVFCLKKKKIKHTKQK